MPSHRSLGQKSLLFESSQGSQEAYNPERLLPAVKHGGGSVMVLAAITCYSVGPDIILQSRITAKGVCGQVEQVILN
jgi:hypothetical protein